MPLVAIDTHSSVVARRALAEVDLHLAVAAHEARLAVAAVVVHQLDAVECPGRRARIGQTLVHVTFASRPNESRRTLAFKRSNLVDADASVMTSALKALVHVDLAQDAEGSVRARAGECVDQIVANAAVLTRIRVAVVDVELAVRSLESRRTDAGVRTD